jgi:CO/xanthine dehydrogenase FAD-binding subunit
MPLWNNYHLAESVADALQALARAQGNARLIAGGTDLLLDLQQGRHPPVDTLVDISGVPDLTLLERRDEQLYIGAAVPLNQIFRSSNVQYHAQALVEACGLIGGPQVRNTATLGGNIAHALPAADGTIALLALGARAEIASFKGRRFSSMEDLFLGPGKSALNPKDDLLVGFHLPLKSPGQASAFVRIMRPQGVALPILNLAVWLHREGNKIEAIRLAMGPVGPRPVRAHQTEQLLQGNKLTPTTLGRSLDVLVSEAHFRTSPYRAGEGYRKELAGVLLEDGLSIAWERAENNE